MCVTGAAERIWKVTLSGELPTQTQGFKRIPHMYDTSYDERIFDIQKCLIFGTMNDSPALWLQMLEVAVSKLMYVLVEQVGLFLTSFQLNKLSHILIYEAIVIRAAD